MVKTFNQAVKFIEQYIPTPDKKYPGELGLKRMQYLMELLGNPQLKYPTVHVGGTSGKGSTTTIIASILATKYKVGLHISPHLVQITEKIKIMQQFHNETMKQWDIPEEEFIDLVNYIKPFIDQVGKSNLGAPSYFEIVAAMAFLYFKEQKVDIAVIEVGMGGRFDATNVIRPEIAVLTNVGLDHTEILGDTVEKIAEDKVGIIKSGIRVISGVKQESVIKIISSKCKAQSAKLSLLGMDFKYKIKRINEKGSVFDYMGNKLLKNLKLRLLGEHQVENASIAIRAIEELSLPRRQAGNYPINSRSSGIHDAVDAHFPQTASGQLSNNPINTTMKQCNNATIKEEDIRLGLMDAYIPGRLEIIHKEPLVILDGAHNQDKVRALVFSIKKIFPKRKITTILAIKNDKNAQKMLAQLLKISDRVIFTKFELTADIGIINSYDPKELFKIARTIDKDKSMLIIDNAKEAIKESVKSANPDDLILVTGSLYLVGEIKRKLQISNYPSINSGQANDK